MTPVIIIGVYLSLVIGLGIASAFYFRGSASDYFVASRSLGPFVLFMTVFGTTMTAFAMVGSTAETYEFGVGTFGKLASWSALVHPACFFLIGLPLWSLGKRHGYITQIEYFRARFESSALGYVLFPVLAGLMIPYVIVGLLGVGSVVGGVTAGAFPEAFAATRGAIPPWLTMAVISAVVLFYIFIGGARSAAWVNVFQTVVFVGMGLLAFWLIADSLGGAAAASAKASPAKAIRTGNMGEAEFFTYWMIPLSVGVFPHVFQNFLTARSAKSYKLLLVMQPISILLAWLPCILIGFWATGATLPGTNTPVIPAGINANAVLGLMVGKLTSPVVSGLVAAGVLAAISLDAQFISIGTMFTRDIVVHRFGAERFTDKQTLWIARWFIVAAVVLTYAATFAPPRQIFALGTWCFSGYAGLIPLLLAALYWKRVTTAAAYASVIATAGVGLGLFVASNYGADRKFLVGGMLPVATVFATCTITVIVVSLFTSPPSDRTLAKFFPTPSSS
ncbi:MAG: sodium:solute symporter family protein [Verrucomicrobia bacterium]|nr:sodium:solute symporter family protein [Verrucomicrobiota bacterium]